MMIKSTKINIWNIIKPVCVFCVLALLTLYCIPIFSSIDLLSIHISPLYFIVGSIIMIIGQLISANIWRLIVNQLGGSLGFFDGIAVFFLSNFCRYIPGKIWQQACMLSFSKTIKLDKSSILISTIIHQVLILVTGISLCFLLFPFFSILSTYSLPMLFILLGLLSFIHPKVFFFIVKTLCRFLHIKYTPVLIPYSFIIKWLILLLFVWLCYGAGFALLGISINAFTFHSFINAIATFVFGYIGGIIAIFVPSGIGVREGIFIVLLKTFTLPQAAIMLSIFSRIWLIGLEILIAIPIGIRYLIKRGGYV